MGGTIMIVSNTAQLSPADPSITAEAVADETGGYVSFVVSNGVEELPFSLDWEAAENIAYDILRLAREAKESESEYVEAQSRHDDEDEDGRCEDGIEGWCPVCS